MIKVSIIVPVYNTAIYLNKCIDSLINQTLQDIEIIIINDGSNDNSDILMKKYKDKRIKYIKKENEGIGKTRNLGIKEATGEYIGFIDSDDYVSVDFCEKMYKKAKEDKCDIVICDFYYDNKGKFKEYKVKEFLDTNINDNPEVLYNINLGPCNKVYNRKMLLDNSIHFDENLKYEDVPFVCKAVSKAKKIGKINEFLTFYVIHNNSQTTLRDEKVFDIFKICDKIINIFKNNNKVTFYLNKTLIRIIIDYMCQQRYQKDKKVASKFIDDSYKYLENIDKKWKKNEIFKEMEYLKAFIIKHKTILKIYCKLYKE